MHQKLQFYHLTHFYFCYSSQSSLRNMTKALYRYTTTRIHYDVINIFNSAKKFRESYLRAFLNDCIQITILDYLFLLRFLSIFFFFYRPAFVPSESTETNSIFLYYPVPTHTQRISHSSIFMTKRKPPFLLGFSFLFVARILSPPLFTSSFWLLSTFSTDLSNSVFECFSYCNFQLEKEGRWWFFTVQIFFSIWIVTTAPFCCLLLQSIVKQRAYSSHREIAHNRCCCYCFLPPGEKDSWEEHTNHFLALHYEKWNSTPTDCWCWMNNE